MVALPISAQHRRKSHRVRAHEREVSPNHSFQRTALTGRRLIQALAPKESLFMIKIMLFVCIAVLSLFVSTSVQAEVPAKTAAAQQALLANPNPTLAKNKRLAYNFMREVFYGCHPELADKFLSKSYVQHNPNV